MSFNYSPSQILSDVKLSGIYRDLTIENEILEAAAEAAADNHDEYAMLNDIDAKLDTLEIFLIDAIHRSRHYDYESRIDDILQEIINEFDS